ncbi:hypothetical protein MIR68_011789 [Amoeboaphelidium protococcarum]|nr:hypothetical protein MIR68_011789 [Amoeboaphelidium protococcarum]
MTPGEIEVIERLKAKDYGYTVMADAVGRNPNRGRRISTISKLAAARSPRSSVRSLRGKLAQEVGTDQPLPSTTSIYRRLKSSGIAKRVCPKKPAIALVNQSRRVAWCKLMKEALRKDPNLIKRLIISDESTERQFPVRGKVMAWALSKLARKKLPINPQRQQGGISVMFFGSMSWHGFGPLIPLEGNQNGQSYIKTIDNAVIPYIKKLRKDHGVRPVFQQDNARCHTAKIVQEHFKTQRVTLLQDELGPDGKWPASSPGLSPIENAWAHVKRLRRERYPTPKTREELINQFTAVWEGLTVQYARKLMESLPNRIEERIKAKGQTIDY